MAVDLDAIARRGRCEVAQLKLAKPLLEQGYAPPFLARYRRDELGGVDESTLWALKTAMNAEQSMRASRDELYQSWEQTPLADPAIGNAIRKSNSRRTLERLRRRLRSESGDGPTDAGRLAVRVMNFKKGEPAEFDQLAESVNEIQDKSAAINGLDDALKSRLAGDPRIISAAVRWLSKHAKIHVVKISDPHSPQNSDQGEVEDTPAQDDTAVVSEVVDAVSEISEETLDAAESTLQEKTVAATDPENESGETATSVSESQASEASTENNEPEASAANTTSENPGVTPSSDDTAATEGTAATDVTETNSAATDSTATDTAEISSTETQPFDTQPADIASAETDSAESTGAPETVAKVQPTEAAPETAASGKASEKKTPAKSKKPKKVSPRQRRRRWLVSVLKSLEGKRLAASKMSAFQVVMLGRALRSQVAVCAFEYDAAKLVAEIQRTVASINPAAKSSLSEIVLKHESFIREAAEAAWWDDLHERASSRLVTIAAEHLRRQIDRGSVESKVVMSIDAVGPRTAATAIVSADGRVLHGEDIPCQLQANLRTQAVAKMGELIHKYAVDLVVISNGPSRRACVIALADLISQSPEKSVSWTLADRSGADAYSGSELSNSEMRTTPRRFRAAAWLAFSILHPAQAYAKIDPMKLRLASFQSELSDDALALALDSVMASGASRGGVDVNSAPTTWLQRLPGMSDAIASAVDSRRRNSLFATRNELLEIDGWTSTVESRQAMPFLRVFGSAEVLDGTLIHPDDYALAKKLAGVLEIELPPDSPPGYSSPSYEVAAEPAEAPEPKLVDATEPAKPAEVEDISQAAADATEFSLEAGETPETENTAEETPAQSAEESAEAESTTPEAESSTPEAESPTPVDESPSAGSDSGDQSSETSSADDSTVDAQTSEDAGQDTSESAGADNSDEPTSDSNPADASTASEEPPAVEPAVQTVRRPLPEKAKIDKCIKEWQVGPHRVNQLVHWLCDPFGDNISTSRPPAVLTTMPTLKSLQPGDQVVGVVVGVMPFGVFLELAPDCSGLIHVSKISDGFVEDLHEAVQVGDVLTAWVTGTDEKRRRVALSALSPEQEARVQEERQQRRSQDSRGGRGYGGNRRGGGGKPGGGQRQSGQGHSRDGGQGGKRGDGKGDRSGGRKPQGSGHQGSGQSRRDQSRGGQSRGGGRDRNRRGGKGRQRGPESYRVAPKEEQKPISDAMQKGDEPLRSFGDLMQFMNQPKDESGPADNDADKQENSTPNAEESPQAVADSPSNASSADADEQNSQPVSEPSAVESPQVNEATGSMEPTSDSTETPKDEPA